VPPATASPPDAPPASPAPKTTEVPAPPEPVVPSAPHPFTARDLLAMHRIVELDPSPDRTALAFIVRTVDLASDRFRSDLWLLPAMGGEPRPLTSGPASEHNPTFAPDGRSVFFLAADRGDVQIFQVGLDAGSSPVQISQLPVPVSNLQLTPSGRTLLFTAEVFVDCPDLACTKQRLRERDESPKTGVLHEQMFVRHWDRDEDGRRSHLFALTLGASTPTDLTFGLDADVPPPPFSGREEFTISPNGEFVVFTAREAGRGAAWSTNLDLFAVPLAGGPLRRLTGDNPAADVHPRFSPDGRTLAWLAMARPGYESDQRALHVAAWDASAPDPLGPPQRIAAAWDRSIDEFVFDPGGQRVLATAANLGQHSLFELTLPSGEVRERMRDGTVSNLVSWGEDAVFLRQDLQHPAEVHQWSRAQDRVIARTHLNDRTIAAAQMGAGEPFEFVGAKGDRVHGYVVTPANFDPTQRYPVAFLIHGGPQGSFGNMFHYRWNPQTYAGAGYAVVMIDFHGSTGYGQAFMDSIRRDWGGKPLEDLKRGLAHALQRYPWLDPDRICALGASYGGFMVNWIESEWPDRFRCLVNHDGVFDHRMMYFSTDELWFPEWEQGGAYFDVPRNHERHNPADRVHRWSTPMLVIHGALDYRVPLTQGLATFAALQRRGIPSQLLVFPNENHWVLRPHNSLQWHETVEAWLARFL